MLNLETKENLETIIKRIVESNNNFKNLISGLAKKEFTVNDYKELYETINKELNDVQTKLNFFLQSINGKQISIQDNSYITEIVSSFKQLKEEFESLETPGEFADRVKVLQIDNREYKTNFWRKWLNTKELQELNPKLLAESWEVKYFEVLYKGKSALLRYNKKNNEVAIYIDIDINKEIVSLNSDELKRVINNAERIWFSKVDIDWSSNLNFWEIWTFTRLWARSWAWLWAFGVTPFSIWLWARGWARGWARIWLWNSFIDDDYKADDFKKDYETKLDSKKDKQKKN